MMYPMVKFILNADAHLLIVEALLGKTLVVALDIVLVVARVATLLPRRYS